MGRREPARGTGGFYPARPPGKGTGKDRDAAKTPAKEPDMSIRERGRGGMDLGL